MNIGDAYQLWCEKATEDPDLQAELGSIAGNEEDILDRFYRSLAFGTAGLRGVIGAGTNRMNVYTVGQATQGLADSLNAQFDNPKVVVAYDSRIKSELFAKTAAQVLAANGVKVYLFKRLVPTPVLSYAVRQLRCESGIIITASHNPAKYNGFKCYDSDGYQMTDESAAKTLACIQKTDVFTGVKKLDFEQGIESGAIEYVSYELMERYLEAVLAQTIHKEVCCKADLKVIYTPLNGAGNLPVRSILDAIGVRGKNLLVVPEQENPDGNFPTCPYPNPEIEQAFEYAMKQTENLDADLLLATDPDSDRVGIAVKAGDGRYELISGNEVGVLLLNYILSERKALGTLPEKPIAVKSFVTTDMTLKVAEKYGCETANLLTGFKYIGELITDLEKTGEEGRFVLGFEESYGYLSGTYCRDKDAVVASMLICEMAAFYKLQGKTLLDVMQSLFAEFGQYQNSVVNLGFEGAEGMQKMQDIMEGLRADAPKVFGGLPVEVYSDYSISKTIDYKSGAESEIRLPKTNALVYRLQGDSSIIIRPSGTEPKIKAYIAVCAASKDEAQRLTDAIAADFKEKIGV